MGNSRKRLIVWLICLLFILLSQGCTTTEELEKRPQLFNGQITLFLKGPEKTSTDITFELTAVNIVTEDGTSREIMGRPQRINSNEVEGQQILLGETTLPEGKYEKLHFVIKEASITKKNRTASLALPPDPIEVRADVIIKRRQNTTLFLTWNADASVYNGYMFKPVFTIKGQVPALNTLLIYVTNEGSDNVSVINRQTGEIVATIKVGRNPRGIAVSTGGERMKVYVANSGSNSVSVIDPTTNKIENEIPVRFGREPTGIVAVRVSSEKELVFVANYGSNTVSMIDASTFQELEKIEVGRGPVTIVADPPIEELVGSRFLSFDNLNILRSYRKRFFNVYVANYDSNDVSVLRIDVQSQTNVEIINLDVEWRPISLTVDYQRGKVYIANYNSNKLSVIDILQIVKGSISDAVSTINNVGTGIVGVIADPAFDRLYLLKEKTGEIAILRPFLEGFDSLKTVTPHLMGTIAVGSLPRAFILDPELRKLYVVNRGSDSISVVDKTTKRQEQTIPVGRRPYGIAIFQN
jgi:YVTN family beta-propeller protein